MRSTLLISAGLAIALAGQALAAPPIAGGPSGMPRTDAPVQSTAPATGASQPDSAPAGSPTGSASDTSAAGPAALSVGEPSGNTDATIGAIASLSTNTSGQQIGRDQHRQRHLQVSSDKLGTTEGAATINLSQTQISGMLHPPAGGR